MKRAAWLLCAVFFALLGTCAQSAVVVSELQPEDGGTLPGLDGPRIDRDAACETVRVGATLTKGPVDVIFLVDNSASMTTEIQAVERNINQSFAGIIESSGLDYRVILLSKHGSATLDQSICITAPLSGASSCSPPPARPQLTPRFFHYSYRVRSTDPYGAVLQTYNQADEFYLAPNGWQAWTRRDAFKSFVIVSDDDSGYPASTFDEGVLKLFPRNFGSAGARLYRVHSICGLRENTPATLPYGPSDPLITSRCSGAQTPGIEHQTLARLTGGLRYPVCQTASYDAVFRAVAEGVVTGARLSCNFEVPPPPRGKIFRLSSAELEYTPGGGGVPRLLRQVRSAAECGPDAFYIEGSRVQLCPSSCAEVGQDAGARVEFLLECDVLVG